MDLLSENVESILHPKNIIVVKEIEEFIYKNNFNLIRYTANAIILVFLKRGKEFFLLRQKKELNLNLFKLMVKI